MQHKRRTTRPGENATPSRSAYDKEVILWSQEQARLLRAGRFSELDIEHLADEIEDVGKSEKRELAGRLAVLLAHLLKWSRQPEKRSNSWRATIKDQRKRISTRSSRRERKLSSRRRICPKPARGRWSRRPIRIIGRSRAAPRHHAQPLGTSS